MVITFCGHSEIQGVEAVRNWTSKAIDTVLSGGAKTFLLGGYGAYDQLCAGLLRKKKAENPDIKLILALPYLDSKMDTSRYDDTVYPPIENVPRRYAILKRNEWMVDQADTVIAYVTHDWGGAAKTLSYAEHRHKKIMKYCKK